MAAKIGFKDILSIYVLVALCRRRPSWRGTRFARTQPFAMRPTMRISPQHASRTGAADPQSSTGSEPMPARNVTDAKGRFLQAIFSRRFEGVAGYALAVAAIAAAFLLGCPCTTSSASVRAHPVRAADPGGFDCRRHRPRPDGAHRLAARRHLSEQLPGRPASERHRTRRLLPGGRADRVDGRDADPCPARHRQDRSRAQCTRGASSHPLRHRPGRHGGDRQGRRHHLLQQGRRAPVRLFGRGGVRPQRQPADARALSPRA